MRVRLLALRFDPQSGGGGHKSLELKLRSMCELGHEASLTAGELGAGAGDDAPYRVEAKALATGNALALARGVAETLRRLEGQADIFHLDGPGLLWGGALYRRAGGKVPVAVWINSYGAFCTNQALMDSECGMDCSLWTRLRHSPAPAWKKAASFPLRLLYERWQKVLPGRIDAMIFDSWAAMAVYESQGIKTSRMASIPPFVDVRSLQEKAPRPPPADPGALVRLACSGRLVREKGVHVLLEALKRLESSAWRLDIVGDGPERARLEDLAQGLGGRVSFHGWLPQPQALSLLAGADIFVHPAIWPEPFGMAVLEAMALGVPAVVPRTSGAAELVGSSGPTFANGDPTGLASCLKALMKDAGLRSRLGRASAARALEFDYRGNAKRLEEVYSLIARPR